MLWSIIGDAGLFDSSVVPAAQVPLSFDLLTGKMGTRPSSGVCIFPLAGPFYTRTINLSLPRMPWQAPPEVARTVTCILATVKRDFANVHSRGTV